MSTTVFSATFRDDDTGELYDPTSVKMSDPDAGYGIKRNDTDAAVVDDDTAMTKISTGIYRHSFTDPAADLTYTAYLEYVQGGETYWVPKILSGSSSATASNSLTFEDMYKEVAYQLYATRAPDATQKIEAKILVNLGYRRFRQERRWTFLEPETTLAVTAADTETALPTDFAMLLGDFHYAPGVNSRGLVRVPMGELRLARAASDTSVSYPYRYAVAPVAGGTWQVCLWPLPSANLTLYYQYRVSPADMSSDTDVPLGGAIHSLTVQAAAQAQAEQSIGKVEGTFAKLYERLLATSLRLDGESDVKNYGPDVQGEEHLASAFRMGTWTYTT